MTRDARPLLVALLVALPLAAQNRTFAPHNPMIRVAAQDVPAFCTAALQGRLGALLAEPEVREAVDLCIERYVQNTTNWQRLVEALARESPRSVYIEERVEVAIRRLDWRDVHSFEFCAAMPQADEADGAAAFERIQGALKVETALALNPVPAAAARVKRWADEFITGLRKAPPYRLRRIAAGDSASESTAATALELEQSNDIDPLYATASFVRPAPPAVWISSESGLLVGGSSSPEIGEFTTRKTRQPGLSCGVDLRRYFGMIAALTSDRSLTKLFEASAIDNSRLFEWRLRVVGDRLQDEFHWSFDGPVGGILGALLTAVAPLPQQPLPDHPMLQLRAAFDVPALIAAVDRLLEHGNIRTLTADGLHEDLRLAWTGGMAFGVTRPGLGSPLVPRLYLSFGIVDPDALGRLLSRLHEQPWVEVKSRELAGVECTILKIPGLPAAFTPAYCVMDDTMHIAESVSSLRALLQAKAAGAPPAMPTGKAPRPQGEGVLSPAFDLRYDNATIHRTVREVWLPLLTQLISTTESKNFLRLDDLPDAELVADYLGPGRGVLRRTEDGIALAMSGTIGGPALTGLATIFGPALSSGLTEQRQWEQKDLLQRLAARRMIDIDRARKAFETREKRPPKSLGELVADGDIGIERLTLPGTELREPVVHGDKELGKTSFRFYPEGLLAEVHGRDREVRLITLELLRWYRLVLTADGGLHEGWGDLSSKTLDEIEAIGREKEQKR